MVCVFKVVSRTVSIANMPWMERVGLVFETESGKQRPSNEPEAPTDTGWLSVNIVNLSTNASAMTT